MNAPRVTRSSTPRGNSVVRQAKSPSRSRSKSPSRSRRGASKSSPATERKSASAGSSVVSVDGTTEEEEVKAAPPRPVLLESPVPAASADEGSSAPTSNGSASTEEAIFMKMRRMCKGGAGPVDVLFTAWPDMIRAAVDRVVWTVEGWGVGADGEPMRISL